MNSQFSIAVHILSLLSLEKEPVSSQYIASSVNSNPSLVRKICRFLKDGQFITSTQGVAGYSLTQPANQILLGEVFRYTMDIDSHFVKIHEDTNTHCPVGRNITPALNDIYTEVDTSIISKLNTYSIEDVINRFE
ncbi:Rrf2 family transcriptional regulator [Staphylococcus lloydii]|uniref:Rrf2 family transcriptional regulator n=1 Tax=Staphylococcus lloydii TaxID=2781774 RepID=UPI0029284189|nr:Rrf2 family transcriptional regulator [Staphylococcus lloydii]MDU9418330.1 Rrf2 family transcriptional regulator [Staphylococcus lloydii]